MDGVIWMGYALIDGKRYYVDDRTKEMTLDNVSQAEADQRERNRQAAYRRRRRVSPNRLPGRRAEACGMDVMHEAQPQRRSFPKEWVFLIVVILFVIGAFAYNQTHISREEAKIITYMEEEGRRETEVQAEEVKGETEVQAEEQGGTEAKAEREAKVQTEDAKGEAEAKAEKKQ